MNNFVFQNPVKVYFGKGQIDNLSAELSNYGKNVLLVYGGGSIKKIGLYEKITSQLAEKGFTLYELSGVEPNPRISSVRKGVEICKEKNIDVVLAVGGGSTLDCSKFICAGACADFDRWKFFSENAPVEKALPLVTILTLAATGSEMDAGGVISNPETTEKLGRSDPKLFPKRSFLDPTLTYSVSKYQTACGAADMISHIMETYFNPGESLYMLDAEMEGLLKTIVKYAPIAMAEPENYEARANLMWASSWAINGFVSTTAPFAWSCHPMEHELSAFYDITHGLGLAILTPRWMEYCMTKDNLDRYVTFAVNVFGVNPNQPKALIAQQGIDCLRDFFYNILGLDDTLTKLHIDDTHFEQMAQKACKGNTIDGFKTLTPKDVENIYRMCL